MAEKIEGFYLDGTEYEIGGTEYTAGEGIEFGTIPDYSAMRGPAPEGFHIPLATEWQGLKTIMNGLGLTTGNNWRINLHIPFAGRRNYSSASLDSQGSNGYYWSSSPYRSDVPNYARCLYLDSSNVDVGSSYNRANGNSVRCFKDSFETPTSSWTVIQGTLGSAGIFWNQSEGLISITDGTTGYTIQDKNLGATTVYNNGDTLSEANCGKYYQWGNNYGFAWTGSVTTSSTQVNASTYGPGNYYSSSTFITYEGWDTSNNGNLWGGETGVVTLDNAITNTGVLSVNGQTGNVTVASPDMSNYLAKDNTTAFTPTGDYQPATKKYVDDHAGTEYNAGQGISIGDISMNARKGPCPDGFHVPSITEWQGVKTIMNGLSLTTGNSWKINLHIPFAGMYDTEEEMRTDKGTMAKLWTTTPSGNEIKVVLFDYNTVYHVGDNTRWRACGCTIRGFKDSFEVPTSSWTVIQGTLGSAGIFWNQTDGLISITSDGSTGYTIMDKNLGATTVYNDGDTLTQANMGNLYQWGNNYGFPSDGNFSKTSYTQVDASGYGPSTVNGYYENDTYILNEDDWSSVKNDDLWGDTTGTITVENVISVTYPEPNVIAMTQAAYDALPAATKNDGKLRIITDATGIEMADKAYVDGLVGDIETLLAAL